MATKISKTMGEQLVKALGNPSYEMVGARTNTERAMIDRGLVFHGRLREPVVDHRGHQVRTHGLMLTDEGVAEAKRLRGEQQGGEVDETITREDVARGVEDALQWVRWADRDEARARGAVRVLEVEFTRARRVMRKLLGSGRYEVEAQAVEHYGRVRALLAAARRFEQEDAAQAAGEESSKVQEQQEQGAPVVTRLAVARNESGMGHGMRVEYVLTAHYADREPVRMAPMTSKGLHANIDAARMPEVVADQLARYGGMAYRVDGRWTLVDPDSEAARLAGSVSRTEVEEARRTVLASLSESYREGLRNKPASVVLGYELSHTRREVARYERVSGAGDLDAMRARHLRAGALLEAARRFEVEAEEFRGLTREDVAQEAARALEDMHPDDRAMVEGKAPSVVLGLAFRRAQTAWCAEGRKHTAEEEAAYTRTANLASAAMIFERADDPEAAAEARAEHDRITNAERAEEARRRDEAHARALEIQWRGAERHGKYLVRTEEAGHGIVRVFVRGSAAEVDSIERASVAYARAHGLRPGASAGGGEFFDGEYIAQRAYDRA